MLANVWLHEHEIGPLFTAYWKRKLNELCIVNKNSHPNTTVNLLLKVVAFKQFRENQKCQITGSVCPTFKTKTVGTNKRIWAQNETVQDQGALMNSQSLLPAL